MDAERKFTRFYGWLLGFYPAGFREEFGDELQEVFSAALQESRQPGHGQPWQVLWRELRDWPGAVLQAHKRGRRFTMVSNETIPEKPLPPVELLAAMILFVLPIVSLILGSAASLPQWLVLPMTNLVVGRVARLPQRLEITLVFLFWGVLLFSIVLALLRGLPGWSLPTFGFLLVVGLVLSNGRIWSWTFPVFLEVFGARLTWSMPVQVGYNGIHILLMALSLLVAALLLVGLLGLLPFTRQVWRRIRNDWTQLSFLLYGGLVFYVVLAFEEYRGDTLWKLAIWSCLAVGAWLYLRARSPRSRILALIGGTTAALWLMALAKWFLIPYQMWPVGYPYSPSEASRWLETSGALFTWVFYLAIMLAPVLLVKLLPPGEPLPAGEGQPARA
jgi:hypothetical protein